MKKTNVILLLTIILMVLGISLLSAEKLGRDVNGYAIQLSRYWTCESDSIPAQAPTVADSIAVPSDAAECVVTFRHQAGYLRPRATTTALAAKWVYVPVNTPVTVPTQLITYLVYRSATGAASVNFVWKRM